jgi:hypothetical protein
MTLRVRDHFAARQMEQRSQHIRYTATRQLHACSTAQPGTAQQIEEHGFSLIATMMRQRNPIGIQPGKYRMTRPSRRRLDSFAARIGDDDMRRR